SALFPYTTLFRSGSYQKRQLGRGGRDEERRIPFPFLGSKEVVGRGAVQRGRVGLSHDARPTGWPDGVRVGPDGERAVGTGDLPRTRGPGAEGDARGAEVQGGLRPQCVPSLAHRTRSGE